MMLVMSFTTTISINDDDINNVGVGVHLLVATAFTTTPIPLPSPLTPIPSSTSSTTSSISSIIPKEHKLYDTYQRIQAWKNVRNKNKNALQEFHVQEEHLLNLLLKEDKDNDSSDDGDDDDDTNNQRSHRITHFVAYNGCFEGSLISKNAVNLACRSGKLKLNNEIVSGARRVQIGDKITYLNDQLDRRTNIPTGDIERCKRFCASRLRLVNTLSNKGHSHTPLRILYEDHYMAIVCKPAGIHTMSYSGTFGISLCLDEILPLLLTPPPNDKNTTTTNDNIDIDIENDTENNIENIKNDEPLLAPLPCHRLDRRVAGPVIVAKTRRALIGLTKSFEGKKVTKEYRALVVGRINMNSNTITNIITTNNNTNTNTLSSFTITSIIDDRESITDVVVLQETRCNINGILTDLQLFPKTGRRHQLRIHCSHVLQTPILGDDLYHDHHGDHDGDHVGDGDDTNPTTATTVATVPVPVIPTTTTQHAPLPVPVVPVRRKHGLYLYCKKVSIHHPILSSRIGVDKNNVNNNDIVSVEIPEPFRITRTREKALKGYEWTQENAKGGDATADAADTENNNSE